MICIPAVKDTQLQNWADLGGDIFYRILIMGLDRKERIRFVWFHFTFVSFILTETG